jgi:hypothetical protein
MSLDQDHVKTNRDPPGLLFSVLFLNPIENKLLDVTLGRHGMLSRQHIFIEEFFYLLKKNVSSQLDQHPGCRDGISDSKTKIKIKN